MLLAGVVEGFAAAERRRGSAADDSGRNRRSAHGGCRPPAAGPVAPPANLDVRIPSASQQGSASSITCRACHYFARRAVAACVLDRMTEPLWRQQRTCTCVTFAVVGNGVVTMGVFSRHVQATSPLSGCTFEFSSRRPRSLDELMVVSVDPLVSHTPVRCIEGLVAVRERLNSGWLLHRYGVMVPGGPKHMSRSWSDVACVAAAVVVVAAALWSGAVAVGVAGLLLAPGVVAPGVVACVLHARRVEFLVNAFELDTAIAASQNRLWRSISLLLAPGPDASNDAALCDVLLRLSMLPGTGLYTGRLAEAVSSDVLHEVFAVATGDQLAGVASEIRVLTSNPVLFDVLQAAPVAAGGWAYGCEEDPVALVHRYYRVVLRALSVPSGVEVLVSLVSGLTPSSGVTIEELCDVAVSLACEATLSP